MKYEVIPGIAIDDCIILEQSQNWFHKWISKTIKIENEFGRSYWVNNHYVF